VSSLEEFDKLLKEFNPNLLVISGLQMMDNYPYPKGKTTAQIYFCLTAGKKIASSFINFHLTPSYLPQHSVSQSVLHGSEGFSGYI